MKKYQVWHEATIDRFQYIYGRNVNQAAAYYVKAYCPELLNNRYPYVSKTITICLRRIKRGKMLPTYQTHKVRLTIKFEPILSAEQLL